MLSSRTIQSEVSPRKALKVGFIPLTDASPIIVAHEQGFFRKQGLHVQLSSEVGWATVRDKMIYREFENAQLHPLEPIQGCWVCPQGHVQTEGPVADTRTVDMRTHAEAKSFSEPGPQQH